MEIEKNSWYKPRQIATNKWITTPGTISLYSIYNFILREIKEGKLRSDNYARGKKGMNYFRVKGEWILNYLDKIDK